MASKQRKVEPKQVKAAGIDPKRAPKAGPDGLYDPLNPGHRWDRPLQAPGRMQVDFGERIDFRRLHNYRLARTRQALKKSGLGALLVFDQYNVRYISSTVIGEWPRDKLTRWCLLTGNGDPWVWDFGSAARHHRLYAPWIPEKQSLAGLVGLRGAVSPKAGLFRKAAEEIRDILKAEGVADQPLGIDVVEPPFLFALQELGVAVRDGQQVMLDARMLKSQDELTLLNMAAAMVDGVYQDIFEALKPGARENEIVALATKRDVDANYVHLGRALLDARARQGSSRVVFGTHDTRIIADLCRHARSAGIAPGHYEFHMLYGIQRSEQLRLVSAGECVRVLIAYGTYWFPWYMRRLAERPANVWFVVKSVFH